MDDERGDDKDGEVQRRGGGEHAAETNAQVRVCCFINTDSVGINSVPVVPRGSPTQPPLLLRVCFLFY